MNPLLADLLQVLKLERLEVDLFRGESRDPGGHRVFGGQVLGQALAAAYATVEGRQVHSLHAYFLRAGDPDHPIVYEVDRSRDGKSFSSRRVVAIQHGEQIFHMSASFQVRARPAIDRQAEMPKVPDPESLPDMDDRRRRVEAQGAGSAAAVSHSRASRSTSGPRVARSARRRFRASRASRSGFG